MRRAAASGANVVLLLAGLALHSAPAFADQHYEAKLIERGLRAKGLVRDLWPSGKRIAHIEIFREEIVAESDPWPNFVNIVHVKTRDSVVKQELLLGVGDRFVPARVAESERNLRALSVLAVARIVGCQSDKPDEVVLLVLTKDLWSLRLNMLFEQTGSLLTDMAIRPTEMNFLGRNKQLGVSIDISWLEMYAAVPYWLTLFSIGKIVRDRVVVGQHYVDPRVLGTRLRVWEQVKLHVDGHVPCGGALGDSTAAQAWCPERTAGALSGVMVDLGISRPLFSLASEWGFTVQGTVELRPVRRYQQNPTDQTQSAPPGERPGVTLEALTFAHPDGTARHVPHVYQRAYLFARGEFTRSFGRRLKHDLTWGMLAYHIDNDEPANFPFDERTRRWFAGSVLPRSESASALYLRYAIRPTRYVKLGDVRTFAVSEDYGLGPALSVETRFANDLVNSGLPFFNLLASARYRWLLARNMLTLYSALVTRYQPGLAAEQAQAFPDLEQNLGDWVDTRLELSVDNTFPPLWIGRFHLFGALVLRKDDLDRDVSRLGGSGTSASLAGSHDNDAAALRGYLSGQFVGRNLVRLHAEYRTRPFSLWTIHCGGVLFYDGGAAWGRPAPGRADTPFRYRQSVGLGLRALIPQIDRESFRLDLGFPLDGGTAGSFDTWFSFSFGQAF